MNPSATASHLLSGWRASSRRYTGSRTRSGTINMIPRWFGSPVSAFGR